MRAATARVDRRGRRIVQVHAGARSFARCAAPTGLRRPCTALSMPRRMLSSLRSSCARLNSRRRRSMRCPVRSSKSISLEHLVQVRVKMLDVARRRQRLFELRARLRLLARHEKLVRQKLHRHGEIERAILGIGRDAHQHIAMVQVLGGEAVALRAEQQGGAILLAPSATMRPADVARRRELPVVRARPRGRARDERRSRRSPRRPYRRRARRPRMSSAPAASALASACGKERGRTSDQVGRAPCSSWRARPSRYCRDGWDR